MKLTQETEIPKEILERAHNIKYAVTRLGTRIVGVLEVTKITEVYRGYVEHNQIYASGSGTIIGYIQLSIYDFPNPSSIGVTEVQEYIRQMGKRVSNMKNPPKLKTDLKTVFKLGDIVEFTNLIEE